MYLVLSSLFSLSLLVPRTDIMHTRGDGVNYLCAPPCPHQKWFSAHREYEPMRGKPKTAHGATYWCVVTVSEAPSPKGRYPIHLPPESSRCWRAVSVPRCDRNHSSASIERQQQSTTQHQRVCVCVSVVNNNTHVHNRALHQGALEAL